MAMCEMYPATWQEFIEEKYFRDHKEIYTNGAEIMLVSDVKKMMQHYSQERPKGRWVSRRYEVRGSMVQGFFCSECDQKGSSRPHFCPNCGADMRESE